MEPVAVIISCCLDTLVLVIKCTGHGYPKLYYQNFIKECCVKCIIIVLFCLFSSPTIGFEIGPKLSSPLTFSLHISVDPEYILYLICWRGTLYPTRCLFHFASNSKPAYYSQQPTTVLVVKHSKSVVPPAPRPVMTPTLSVLMNVFHAASALVLLHYGRMGSVLFRNSVQVLHDFNACYSYLM